MVVLSYPLPEVQGQPFTQDIEIVSGTVPPTATPIPPSLTSVNINDGATDTTTDTVGLRVAYDRVIDRDPWNPIYRVEVSSDGVEWIATMAHRNSMGIPTNAYGKLSPGNGIKTIYARSLENPSVIVSDTINMDTSADQNNSLSINEDAIFTNHISVTLKMGAEPYTSQMQVSNGGGFLEAEWEPFSIQKQWAITQFGNYVIPRTVYMRFKYFNGEISSTYQDDIILDVTPPVGSISVVSPTIASTSNNDSSVTLNLSASDDVSGVAGVIISTRSDFTNAVWESIVSTRLLSVTADDTTVYAKFKDNAGNISGAAMASIKQAPMNTNVILLPLVSK